MTAPILVRRHADGRWAVFDPRREFYGWWVSDDAPGGPPTLMPGTRLHPGDGWSELFVTELPEPDYSVGGNDVWDVHTGEITVGAELETPHLHSVDQLRSDALKMLAAVAAFERYQAEREAAS